MIRHSTSRWLTVTALALAPIACSGGQQRPAPPLQPLSETRALEVIREAFEHVHVEGELHKQLHLRSNRVMDIDLATVGHPHGVEYLQAQDRADFGDVLPQRRNPDALLTCVGIGDDASIDVLLLDDHDFMYQTDPAFYASGQPTLVEVEDRLRRQVIDYLSYLQHHGEL